MNNLVFRRQIQYTVFVAVPSIRLCRVVTSPLSRAGMRQHPRLLRRYFMPGKSPPCRILTLTAGICKSFLFRKKKAPISDRNNGGNRGERKQTTQTARTPTWGISGQMSGHHRPIAYSRRNDTGFSVPYKHPNPNAKNADEFPYGSRYGSQPKNAGNHRKTKTPGNRMNTRFPGTFTGRSDVT